VGVKESYRNKQEAVNTEDAIRPRPGLKGALETKEHTVWRSVPSLQGGKQGERPPLCQNAKSEKPPHCDRPAKEEKKV